ncbi:MAG: Gfo/Idh/MocA family protein [Candidatus Dormibacteraceae bacterium]
MTAPGAGSRLGWGIVGAAWIAGRAVIPAIAASRNGRLAAIASRDQARARRLAGEHSIPTVHPTYRALLEDEAVEAVYIPLANSLHREWTVRALAAGKHVLCEKPLAVTAAEGEAMASASATSGRLLMEALMYRFHPRMTGFRARVGEGARFVSASFGFPLDAPGNYRLDPALGGGALLDVGSYVISAARWFLGEPDHVVATARADGVDLSVAIALGFPGGAQAALWASFESPEHQDLVVVARDGPRRAPAQPFTAWRNPEDPYQLMVEAFGDAAIAGAPPPVALEDSIANLTVIDRVRAAAGIAR